MVKSFVFLKRLPQYKYLPRDENLILADFNYITHSEGILSDELILTIMKRADDRATLLRDPIIKFRISFFNEET